MFKLKTLLLALALSIGIPARGQDRDIKELADHLATQAAAGNRKVIGVVAFTRDGLCPAFGEFLANRLSILLVAGGKQPFQVVTRSRINEVLREVQLKNARGFNEKTFAELGRLAGADTIVSGEITIFGSKLNVDAQLLDVATGRIVGGAFVEIAKTSDLDPSLTSRECPGAGVLRNQSPPAVISMSTKSTHSEMAVSKGLVNRMPGSVFVGKITQKSFNPESTLAISHCERGSNILRCVQVVSIEQGEAVEAIAIEWWKFNQVWDSTGELHKLVDAFFVSTEGKRLPVVNLGKGEAAVFVQDFEAVSETVKHVKITANGGYGGTISTREVRNIPVF